MTRLELVLGVCRRTAKATAPINPETETRILGFLNARQRRLLGMSGMSYLRDDTLTFPSVAGQSRYALPNIAAITRMWETTNDRTIGPMSLADYRRHSPDASVATGDPADAYVFHGYEPVAKQPTDASELFVKSTSASDTQVVYWELDITAGYPRTGSVALTGTTAVSLNTGITTAIRVRKFYLASPALGTITLHEDSGVGTELARIGIGQTQQKYWVCSLYPQPTAVNTYVADYTMASTDLAANTDEPRLPEDFHFLLELGATMDELAKTDDTRYIVADREYREGIRELTYWIAKQASAQSRPAARSRLGSWYPAGT